MYIIENEQDQAFRAQIRNFIDKNLPTDIRSKVEDGLKLHKDDYVRWQQILYKNGYFAASWPEEHGGPGWNIQQQYIFHQEAAICNAPFIIPYGVNMVGPIIYNFGSPAQKEKYLPGILNSETWWCQGYSEPNAGSDLASLKLSTKRDGDHYVLNGTKMWTTEAHWADMMHCLARTDNSGRKQEGITFLLIDMKTPGLTVEPIVTLDDVHHTNQVFFDNVRVPIENRVGEEGDGWRFAKFLLSHERSFLADSGSKIRLLKRISGMINPDVDLQVARYAEYEARLIALCAMERQSIEKWADPSAQMGAEASMLKVMGTELLQDMAELAVELEGPYATAYDVRHLSEETNSPHARASTMSYQYLYSRCWSIFGGSNEIQRSLIARHTLA